MFTLNNIESITTILASIVTILGIFYIVLEVKENKKNRLADKVSSNRIDWIKEVRTLIFNFINELSNDGDDNKKNLLLIKNHIELYCNKKNPDQDDLLKILSICIEDNSDSNREKLLNIAESVLSNSWRALKMEVGQDKNWHQKNIHSHVYEDYSKVYDDRFEIKY